MQNPDSIITEKAQIINLLHRLQHSHSLLSLSTNQIDAPQNSLIVSMQTENNSFAVDGIDDPEWHSLIRPSTALQLAGRLDGVKFECAATVLAITEAQTAPLYQLQIPDQVKYKQRRRHFRARVESKKSMAISIPLSVKQYIQGVVVDISASGICSRVDMADATALTLEQSIQHVRIALPDSQTLTCDLALRNLRHFPEKGFSLIGGEFLHIAPSQLHHVERLVATLDRSRRRSSDHPI